MLETYAIGKSLVLNVGEKSYPQVEESREILESNTCESKMYMPSH